MEDFEESDKTNIMLVVEEKPDEAELEENKFDQDNELQDEEKEEEEETKPVKKRRCQRRKKIKQLLFDDEDNDEEGEEESAVCYEEGEDEDEDKDEEAESVASSKDSSVLSSVSFEWENKIYEFEELCDPGYIKAIYKKYRPEPELFDESGVYRYLSVCQALNITPSTNILRSLSTTEIDLSSCNPSTPSIRALCAALETNNIVSSLIMKNNKLKRDDCYYIGLVLHYNETLRHLDFTGCRVGAEGLELLIAFLPKNDSVENLLLSKCNIQDEGMKFLAYVLMLNHSIKKLDLSYNKLGNEAADSLAAALKINTSVTDLNLRYNYLFDPASQKALFRALTSSSSINRLDLSWNGLNGPETGSYVGNFLRRNGSIQYFDLSDNRFEGLAVIEIKKGLSKSRSLEELKIGKNPMSPEDLDALLSGAKGCSTLTFLDLEDLWVKKTFIKSLKKLQQDRDITVKFAGIFSNYDIHGPDYPKVILLRAQFEAMKPKKAKQRKDFGHLIWTLGDEPLTSDEFMMRVKKFKAKISKDLFPELIKQFTIPKVQLIDVIALRQKYLSIFPDSTPPPPPKLKKGKKEQSEIKTEQQTEMESIEKTPPAEVNVELTEKGITKVGLDDEMIGAENLSEEENEITYAEETVILPEIYEETNDEEENVNTGNND